MYRPAGNAHCASIQEILYISTIFVVCTRRGDNPAARKNNAAAKWKNVQHDMLRRGNGSPRRCAPRDDSGKRATGVQDRPVSSMVSLLRPATYRMRRFAVRDVMSRMLSRDALSDTAAETASATPSSENEMIETMVSMMVSPS